MKTIYVEDATYDFLMELSKELNSQNNRATAVPYFFQIETDEEIAVPDGCGTHAWYYDGSKIETDEEIVRQIFDYYDGEKPIEDIKKLSESEKEEELKNMGWNECNYDYMKKYQNAFLTEKACRAHIAGNQHHYNKPIDYLSHAFRNPELEMVLVFIMGLTKK
jgi:hypothetical protein